MDLSTLMPQQLQIVKTLDRPLFVSAGAGSGKTFTLTRRIVYALSPESGPFVEHLDQVLAITFTKDAAAEIRDRVRRALIDEGMDEEALTVDDAWILTIHGMCSRILRAHALELGIDPEFTVLTDTDELMDQAVEHVLGRATAPDAAPELAASLKALYAWYPMAGEGGSFGAGTTIKGLVRDLLELSSQLPGGMDDVRVARGQADTLALADAYRAALGASKAATEKAQVALDGERQDHGRCGATHDVVHHAAREQGIPQGAGRAAQGRGRRCVYQYRACLRWPGARCAGGSGPFRRGRVSRIEGCPVRPR